VSHRPPSAASGFALLSALLLAMAAGGIVLVMSITSMGSHKLAQTRAATVQTRYLAEGAIEFAKLAIRDAVALGELPPTGGIAAIDGIDVPYVIAPLGTANVTTDGSGFESTVQSYEIACVAASHGVRSRVSAIVNARWTPIFQYAVFFEQSLDILPTPDMVLTGRVHTNGDLRLGCNTATLTIDSNHVRAVGDLRRWKKHSDTPTVGDVLIRKWVANPFDIGEPVAFDAVESLSQMTSLGITTTTGYDSLFAGHDLNGDGTYDVGAGDWLPFDAGVLDRYGPPSGYPSSGNTLQLGAHGVTKATPPPIGTLGMFDLDPTGDYEDDGSGTIIPAPGGPGTGTHKKGFFHANADLSILVAADGASWTALDVDDFDVSASVASAISVDTTYDKRQGGYVRVVKIDMAALNASAARPANGLLYVNHYGMGTGTDNKGVHLFNGADLADDLTVVCEGSAYIQGDYNTATPESAAVIADAVNLLSNSWTNTTSKPTASDTTYNVAMIVGNTETTTSAYNGGLENLPRFHEKWSKKTCTVVGSMISAWQNVRATGAVSSAQFDPPDRDYRYDTRFNDVAQLPPFTPRLATVVDIVRW